MQMNRFFHRLNISFRNSENPPELTLFRIIYNLFIPA